MDKKQILWLGLLAVVLVLIVLLRPLNVNVSSDGFRNTVSVAGEYQLDTAPDQAEIYLAVETQDKDAKVAQQQNADLMKEVLSMLKFNGVNKEDVETTDYNLYPMREYNYEKKRYDDQGFRVTNSIKVTTKKLDSVGKILDAGVIGGSNRITDVRFSLSKEKKREVFQQALDQASKNAESKAKAIADSLSFSLGKVARVSESNVDYTPPIYYAKSMMMESSVRSETPIEPKKVTVSARVGVEYNIA